MNKSTMPGFTETGNMFFATLLLRVASVVGIIFTLPVRYALPLWMAEWFQRISYPLLVYNLSLLIFYKKITIFLQKYPFILFVDLFIAIGILQIGGGWRSSYFVYTLTTIMVFTLFFGIRGSYISASALVVASIIKDPSGGLPSLKIFDASSLDMRLGAALFYIVAGLITGYFSTLLKRLEMLSKAEVEETRKLTAMEEKTRMALELHDGAKQIVAAMLLKINPLIKRIKPSRDEIADELRWFWRGLNYLQSELNQVMDTLKREDNINKSMCNIVTIAEEEVRIAEVMTGFSWKILPELHDINIPIGCKLPLRRFFSEALMNAWKHSGATTGTIEIKCTGESVTVTVRDDGKGFNYSDIEGKETTGLKSLKYRAGELNGELKIETAPDKGCKLILSFPAYK
ncbi:MAG: ATP-binding protein [Nitrospirota bacterium]